ncbi:hypothetical protein ACJIZ3_012618 [Penstemon smallii]|uniref:Uncharacterized protein n=1 Tax=Penstemon smallii TaxID=265156 RepID=A0ABD3UP46_9LAMI
MQQRQTTMRSSRFVQYPTSLLQQLFKRRNLDDLPVYGEERHFILKRPADNNLGLGSQKLVHLIPVTLLLCLFTLWWFSYPVNLEIKDGRITSVQNIVTQLDDIPVVHLTSLASISPSYTSNSQMQIANNGSIEQQPSTKDD